MTKTRMTALAAAAAIAAISGTAAAQNAGDVVFTTDDGGVWFKPLGGSAQLITTIADPGAELNDLAFGPTGALFVNSGPRPVQTPSTAAIYRIDDPFGTPSVSVFSQSDPLQNPIGLVYDAGSNSFLTPNNPGTAGSPSFTTTLIGVNANTGVATGLLARDTTSFPTYDRGSYLAANPGVAGEYFASTLAGSATLLTNPPAGFSRASTLHRISVSPDLTTTESLIVDLGDTSITGLSHPVARVSGVTAVDSQTLFISAFDFDDQVGTIYRVDLDTDGNFAGIQSIISSDTAQPFLPGELEYNPFTGTLLFADRSESNVFGGNILEINLDGTGLSVFANEGRVRGIAIIPSPAGAALLAMGGLVASRRRRA